MKKIILGLALLSCFAWSNSLEEIQKTGVLRVGVGVNMAPFSKLDEEGFDGFEVKLAKEIGRRIFDDKKGRVELVGINVKDRIPALQNNKVDIIIRAFSVTKERRKLVDFSTPYFLTDIAIMTRKEDKIKGIASLRGRKILAGEGSVGHKRLKEIPDVEIVLCHGLKNCVEKLENKEADGFINDNTILLGYIVNHPEYELGVKSYGRGFYTSIGVQKGNDSLLKFINKNIVSLGANKFFHEAFKQDLDPFYKGTANEKYFLLDDLYGAINKLK